MNLSSRPTGFLLVALGLLWVFPGPGRPAAAAPPTSTASSDSLSFGRAVILLETRNQQLMAAAQREDSYRQEQLASRGLRLPTVKMNARLTRIDDPIIIDLNGIRASMLALHSSVPSTAVPPFETRVQDDQFFKAGLDLNWPLFTGGAISAAKRAADARLNDARGQTRAAQQELHATLVQRYFGLCLAEQVWEIRQQVLDGMEKHSYQAGRLEEEGMISRAEVLHAEVSRAEAARKLQGADQDVLLAKEALRALLNEDIDPQPTSSLFIVHHLPPLEDFQEAASDANPDLLRLEARKTLARSALSVERADYLPDVALFARYELYPDDLTLLEPRWAVGVGLQLNVFDGFARTHRVKAARATVSMVDHIQQDAQTNIDLLVEQNYRRAIKAMEQFDSLEATIALAEENLRMRTRAFEEGMATSLDVVDAVNMLAGVELARLAAAHEYVVALAELLAATGHVESFADYMQMADREVTS